MFVFCVASAVLFVIVGDCQAAPPNGGHGNSTGRSVPQVLPAEAINFMRHFGYLEKGYENAEALISENTIIEAIRLVQRFGGLPETGILDTTTAKLMTSRRCGCPDILPPDHSHDRGPYSTRRSRRKRYVIASRGWRKRNLKYKLANWSSKMNQWDMEAEMERAFNAWAMYSRLKFRKVEPRDNADITILFGYQHHNDAFPFDGPGGVLAHAFYPYERVSFSGQVHFDEEEPWVINATAEQISNGAVDFYRVAVHELGHSLGLGHSHVASSIMFPYYQPVNGAFVLGDDDVRAMHELYLQRTMEDDDEPEVGSPPTPKPHPPRLPPSTTPRTTTTFRTTRPTTTTRSPPRRRNTTTPRPTTTTARSTTIKLTYENDSMTVEEHLGGQDKCVHHDTHYPHRPKHPFHSHKYHHHHDPHCDGGNREPNPGGSDSTPNHGQRPDVSNDNDAKQPPIPDICAGNFDAAAVLRGELFIFKGAYLWRLRKPGQIMTGYPARISAMFAKLPAGTVIDAAYQRPTDGNIVLFSGKNMWVYTGSDFVENRPRPLSDVDLPSYVNRVDAAMVWAGNGATYFFSEDRFWRYNETTRKMDQNYPLLIKERWKNMPSRIDAALTWKDGLSYFFKGNSYWRFDNARRVATSDSPHQGVHYWVGC